MACISLPIPSSLLDAQSALNSATNTMLTLTGETCNIFGLLGLGDLEAGIQNILGVIGSAMGFINDTISAVQDLLNGILDTALSAVNDIIENILGGINQVLDFAQGAVNAVTGMIDEAINVLAEKANLAQILACAGVLDQLGAFPPNVTSTINDISGFLAADTPITDITNLLISGARDNLMNNITGGISNITGQIADKINGSQDLIDLNINSLGQFTCAV
jgi:hypothetical protein